MLGYKPTALNLSTSLRTSHQAQPFDSDKVGGGQSVSSQHVVSGFNLEGLCCAQAYLSSNYLSDGLRETWGSFSNVTPRMRKAAISQ